MLSGKTCPRSCDVADQTGNQEFIFYPCIPYERNEIRKVQTTIITARSLLLMQKISKITWKNLQQSIVNFMNPFLALDNEEALKSRLFEELEDSVSF